MNERIKKLRKALDLTQREFGERIGVKPNTIATYEIGRNEPIDAVISLICREFNVSETWLRTGEGKMFAPEPAFDLSEYANRHGMTALETEILKAYLDLDPSVRESLLQHFKQRLAPPAPAATSKMEPTTPAPDTLGQERTEADIAARVVELERQNQELAAEVAALKEEDAKMEAAEELSASEASSGDTKLA